MCITCSDLAEPTSNWTHSASFSHNGEIICLVTAPKAPVAYPNLATAARVSATSGTQLKSLPQETLLPALPDAIVRRQDGRENETDTGLWRNRRHVGSIQECLHLSNNAEVDPKWRLRETQFLFLVRPSRDCRTRSDYGADVMLQKARKRRCALWRSRICSNNFERTFN